MNRRSAEESKKKILDAASRVFAEHGYGRANMRLIARDAGISVGGLYLYFENKEGLCLTLMQERMEALTRETAEVLARIDDPREALRAFVRLSLDHARRNRSVILLQGAELGLTFGAELKGEFFRARRRVIEEIVRRGTASGVFRSCDAAEVAKVVFNVVRGYVVSMLVDEDSLFDPEACVDLFLRGLAAA